MVKWKEVGDQEGGFTPFEIDVGSIINSGEKNYLAIRVNNELNESTLPPSGVDWFNYGGVVREVYLEITDQVYISDVRVNTQISGTVNVEFELVNQESSTKELAYKVAIFNISEELQAVRDGKIQVKEKKKITCHLLIKNPQLWDTANPYLYRLEVIIQDQDRTYLIDKVEENIGIREIKVDGDKILLNGQPIKIRGVSHHEDYTNVGRTIFRLLNYQDYSLMKKANVNLIRLAHYPHSKGEIEVADHLGIMLMEEIPAVFLKDEQMAKPR